jgi:hypothetical protein
MYYCIFSKTRPVFQRFYDYDTEPIIPKKHFKEIKETAKQVLIRKMCKNIGRGETGSMYV